MDNKAFVIIPAYNEAFTIEKVIGELLPLGISIVVVDDASTDETAGIVSRLPAYYLRHRINFGQGAALQTGISFALEKGAEWFVTFDADGQHSADDIPPMLETLLSGECDIIFGSRFLAGEGIEMPYMRKRLVRAARYVNYLLTGIMLTDAHNGLRAFNRRTASVINILEARMAHATEILMTVRKHRLRYLELPVDVRYTEYSRSKGQKNSHSFKVLQDIILYKIFK